MTVVGLSCILGNITCLVLAYVYIGDAAAALVILATVTTMAALADMESTP